MTAQSRAWRRNAEKQVTRVVQAFALELIAALKRNPASSSTGTPVDTGHARANWILSVGSPDTAERGRGGDDGRAAILAWSLDEGPIYANNNAPYILRLNDGWSDQQPAGFIERAIDEAQDVIRRKFVDANIIVGTVDAIGGDAAGNLADAYNPLRGDE